jgi:hypothetical protein
VVNARDDTINKPDDILIFRVRLHNLEAVIIAALNPYAALDARGEMPRDFKLNVNGLQVIRVDVRV